MIDVGVNMTHLSALPWFVWAAATLLPFGAVIYARSFYREHLRSFTLWKKCAALILLQIALFLFSFTLFPRFAFFINVVTLPLGYYLLDSNLKKSGIARTVKDGSF
jgi:hypothetical protein